MFNGYYLYKMNNPKAEPRDIVIIVKKNTKKLQIYRLVCVLQLQK